MAKRCTEGGTVHGEEVQVSTDEQEIGNEIVMYGRIECADCGAGLRNIIISRRPKS